MDNTKTLEDYANEKCTCGDEESDVGVPESQLCNHCKAVQALNDAGEILWGIQHREANNGS